MPEYKPPVEPASYHKSPEYNKMAAEEPFKELSVDPPGGYKDAYARNYPQSAIWPPTEPSTTYARNNSYNYTAAASNMYNSYYGNMDLYSSGGLPGVTSASQYLSGAVPAYTAPPSYGLSAQPVVQRTDMYSSAPYETKVDSPSWPKLQAL